MALVQCKNCGKEVSDKAEICPNCGERLKPIDENSQVNICEECGSEVPKGAEVCPNCGCPIKSATEDVQPQQVKVVGISFNNKKIKGLVSTVVVLIAVVAVGTILYGQHQKKAYKENLELASYTMLLGASDAEEAGNLIKSVWYNCIYEEFDSETDKYTRNKYGFYDDFNDALGNLFSDDDFQDTIADIENNQETVSSLMKELKNPPNGYEDAYDAIKTYYDTYLSFTNFVTSPTGNLTTFSSNFNDLDSATANAYNAMKLYLD